MASSVITSKENALYKKIKKLKMKKYRDAYQEFIIEDDNVFSYIKGPCHYVVKESKFQGFKKCIEGQVYTVFSDALFDLVSTLEHSKGLLCIASIPCSSNALPHVVFVLDGVQDPGNLGTIIRTLDAFGFTKLLLTPQCADVYNDKTIRSTMGSLFSVETVYLKREDILDSLNAAGYELISTTLTDKSVAIQSVEITEKMAVILGSEGQGVSDLFLKSSSKHVKIPMQGNAESLNVGVAAGIVAYEIRGKIDKRL